MKRIRSIVALAGLWLAGAGGGWAAVVVVVGVGAILAQEAGARQETGRKPALTAETNPAPTENVAAVQPRDLTPVTGLKALEHAPVDLVREGKAVAVVYVVDPKGREAFDWRRYLDPPRPPNTPPALLVLVHELRDAIREATGATLELVAEPPAPGQPAIVIGDCAESQAAGIDAAELPAEGFVVRTTTNRIYLVGSTRPVPGGRPNDGVAWAVADFLERFVGVRWYWPVEYGGRSVPRTASLTIPPAYYRDQPVCRLRQYGRGGALGDLRALQTEGHNAGDRMPLPLAPGLMPADGRPFTEVFGRPLLRAGDSCDFQPGLIQGQWGGFAISRQEKDPLYSEAVFALKSDGSRDKRWNCYSAPETLDAYLDTLKRYWDSGKRFSFSHNIIAENSCTIYLPRGICYCPSCRDAAVEGGAELLMCRLATRLGEEVKKRWSGKKIVMEPFEKECPKGMNFPDNLVVANVYPEGFYLGRVLHPSYGSKFEDAVRAWGQVSLWCGANSPGDWTYAPVQYPHLIRDFCARNRGAIVGMDLTIFSGKIYVSDAPTLYVWMRALWNPDLDVDAVLDELCRRQFGAAAGTCRELLRLECDRWATTSLSRPLDATNLCRSPQTGRGLGTLLQEYRLPVDQFREFWPPEVVAQMKALRDRAAREIEQAGDDAARRAFLYWTWTFDAFLEEAETVYRKPQERDVREAALATTNGLPAALTLDLGRAAGAAGLPGEGAAPAGGVALKLGLIPAGECVMGGPSNGWAFHPDEGPQHKVRITKPFYMGIHEVTVAQYASVMEPGSAVTNGSLPVMNVSWHEAVEFCRKLGGMTRKTVRLPTEAEWEYACRAGTTTEWFFGDPDTLTELGEYAWYTGKPAWKLPREAGGKKPNPWGLYDLYGNVAEWCQDRFAPDYYAWSPVDNPAGPATGLFRVVRGGSAYNLLFGANAELARSARRTYAHPDVRGPGLPGFWSEIGFRVVVEAGETSEPGKSR
jgi:formylglycine-generating enzyme required for sulfatase activity